MRKKILVLDDKIAIAKVLSIYLASDYDCIWLPNGIEGVKWLQEGNIPDLIISDIRMPEMRGDAFLEWINSSFEYIRSPFARNGWRLVSGMVKIKSVIQTHSGCYAKQRRQYHRTHPPVTRRRGRLYCQTFQSHGVKSKN